MHVAVLLIEKAMHAALLLIEKHHETQSRCLAFLDLKRHSVVVSIGIQLVCNETAQHPRKPHRERPDLDVDLWSRVQLRTSAEFPISVGFHQGSALSPLLFIAVVDAIPGNL